MQFACFGLCGAFFPFPLCFVLLQQFSICSSFLKLNLTSSKKKGKIIVKFLKHPVMMCNSLCKSGLELTCQQSGGGLCGLCGPGLPIAGEA